MAGRWRIRHKLMLGLGLVVGILALLLAGTLKGLASYRATTSSMDSKLEELREAHDLKVVITNLAALADAEDGQPEDAAPLRAKLQHARQELAEYQEKLTLTLERRRDLDRGFKEKQQVQLLEGLFDKLERVIGQGVGEEVRLGRALPAPPWHAEAKLIIHELLSSSNDLQDIIYHDLRDCIIAAKVDFRHALWIILTTSIVGVLLMVGLLRFFYGWVFYPIRDLALGVGRVAQGDFEKRIEVHSGDEIEDLAQAYNDMTGRLRDMYADLAHQVNERSRQLVRSERLAGVGFLAAGVAHEINNPLASIAFCAEALEARLDQMQSRTKSRVMSGGVASGEDRIALTTHHSPLATDPDNEVVGKYLKMIQDEAFRCKKITERLLEFSRPGERQREPADLTEIVQAVLDMMQHHQSGKGKQVVLKSLSRVEARVNVQEIKSVVLNLVVNALDSMDDGGTLAVRLRQRDGMAEMEFSDTGCGMTAEVLENIFEPFFTRSRTGKGTGLGLTISHRIVSQHGGEIEAASPGPGQGSTFTVRLPLEGSDQLSAVSYQPEELNARAA